MFNLGSKEILIIALIILFLFGSKKLTDWAKSLGEAGKELKKAKKEFTSAMDETEKDLKKNLAINEESKKDEENSKSKISKEDKVKEVTENEDI